MVIQNEALIPIIRYLYQSGVLKIIDKLTIHFDSPRPIAYSQFNQIVLDQIEQMKLLAATNALVKGCEIRGY